MKKPIVTAYCPMFLIVVMMHMAFPRMIHAQVIAQWTFETSQPATSGPHNAETGSGIATSGHAGVTTFSSPTGNGSDHSFNANTWTDGDYFQFVVNTTGYQNINFAYDQTGSSTGPQTFQIQISLNGTSFTTIVGSNYNVAANAWSASSVNAASAHAFSLPGMGNQPMLIIRIRVVTGSTAINASPIAPGGTSRVDNVNVTGSVMLPLTLLSFTGERKQGKHLLNWEVASQTDVVKYIVEQASNARDFYEAGAVDAWRDGGAHRYSFTNDATAGDSYYRLKMVSENGIATYSHIITLEQEVAGPDLVLLANPVQDKLQLGIKGEAGKISYTIRDISGRLKIRDSITGKTAVANLNVSTLPAGIYILTADVAGKRTVFRFLKE